MRSTVKSNAIPAYGSCIFATFGSTFVGAIRPVTRAPATKGPSNWTPNQVPNSFASLTARQTRSRGAFSRAFFSMRSVCEMLSVGVICNLQVAYVTVPPLDLQPKSCMSRRSRFPGPCARTYGRRSPSEMGRLGPPASGAREEAGSGARAKELPDFREASVKLLGRTGLQVLRQYLPARALQSGGKNLILTLQTRRRRKEIVESRFDCLWGDLVRPVGRAQEGSREYGLEVGARELFRGGIDHIAEPVDPASRAGFLQEDAEELVVFFPSAGIEERQVLFGTALPLQVDRDQVGPGRDQEPDDAAPILGLTHERREGGEDSVGRPGVALLLSVAEESIRFVDHDDDRIQGSEHLENLLDVGLGDPLPL